MEPDLKPIEGVSVMGLGRIGMCMAAGFAARGFPTIGVDVQPEVVRSANAGRPTFFEPGLEDALRSGGLRATEDLTEAVRRSDVTYIVVSTPSEEDGRLSLRSVQAAARALGKVIGEKKGRHLVVLCSTVLPGATEYGVIPLLERESGRRCGEGFDICYVPEFVARGSTLRDFLEPKYVIIGEAAPAAGERLEVLYRRLCKDGFRLVRTSLVNAELAKIAVNTYVTTKITFGNLMAALCERLPGGDVDVVQSLIGMDPRIGPLCLKGGLGYGGSCFPRDNAALTFMARSLSTDPSLPMAVDRFNLGVLERIVNRVLSLAKPGASVSVLGLAFKGETDSVENSHPLMIAEALAGRGLCVTVHDPKALKNSQEVLVDRVRYAETAEACLAGSDVVLVASPEAVYKEAVERHLETAPSLPVVIDCWRILEHGRLGEGVRYYGVGLGNSFNASSDVLKRMWGKESQ